MKKFIIFAILANLISCYTYINDELPRIRPIKKKIKIELLSFRVTGIDDSERRSIVSNRIQERFEKSGLFDKVNAIFEGTAENANRHHVEIHFKELNVFEKNYMTVLSGAITAGATVASQKTPFGILVPFYRTNKYSMLVDYYVDGKLKRYDRFNQSSTRVFGLIPALFALRYGDSVDKPEEEIVTNMADNAVFYLNELNYAETVK